MTSEFRQALFRLAMEPPFRIVARALLARVKVSPAVRALWDLSARPAYLVGLLAAVEQAKRQKIDEIAVIEFGVAGGAGLLAMEYEAAALEREFNINIKVFGFDMGAAGLPEFIGDHRDHPDIWQSGDYPMDEAALKARLSSRTTLVLGNLRETVPRFLAEHTPPPIGFVSVDVDLYSSARDALALLAAPGMPMLWHVPVYLDDIEFIFNHRFAGELLAVHEFNTQYEHIKIDRWYGLRNGRPFPERPYLEKLFVAHDLVGVAQARPVRERGVLSISKS